MTLEVGIFGKGSFRFKAKNLPELWISIMTFDATIRADINLVIDKKLSSIEFTRNLLTDLAYFDKNENDKVPRIEIDKIDEEDLSLFANLYVENNKYQLSDFAKTIYKKNKDKTESDKFVDLDFQKNETESNFEYLVRFFKTKGTLFNELFKNEIANIDALYNSDYLKPLIDKQLLLKSELESSFNQINYFIPKTNSANEMFSTLDDKISVLVKIGWDSAKLVEGLHNIVLGILNESKIAAKKTEIFNYIIIVIAIISLLTTMVFSILSYNSNEASYEYNKKHNREILNYLKKQTDIQESLFSKEKDIDSLSIK
jgi:hypothetical protein